MAKRQSFARQFVTKTANFGGSFNPSAPSFNSRCHGVVVKEYTRKVGRNTSAFAEVMLFPSGRIEEILKSRLHLIPEELIALKIRSSPKYWQYQRTLTTYQESFHE
jgi:hypothetical protein